LSQTNSSEKLPAGEEGDVGNEFK